MDKRKKRTAYHQYVIYLKMLEEDQIFRTGIIPRDGELNYLTQKWEELAESLNSCGHGPMMSADEWKKRLNDWKNSTRAKFRKCRSDQYKQSDRVDMALTPLEEKALLLWGPFSNKSLSANSEQSATTYTLPVEVQQPDIKSAEICIKTDSGADIVIEPDILSEPPPLTPLQEPPLVLPIPVAVSVQAEEQPPQPQQHDQPEKRKRLDSEEDQTFGMLKLRPSISLAEVRSLAIELRRIADVKEEKLKFEIAKFKFRNPGFEYNYSAAPPSSETNCMEKPFEADAC